MNQTFYRIAVIVLCAVILLGGILLILQNAAPAKAPDTGEAAKTAPDFTMEDANGNTVKLSERFGTPIVLNFWASWCGPCKAEMPEFQEAYLEYGDQVQFMMVNLTDGRSETVDSATAFLAQQPYTFPVFFDSAQEATYAYGITGIPMTVFIRADGSVESMEVGMLSAERLKAGIDAILNS